MTPLLRRAAVAESDECAALLHIYGAREAAPLGTVGWTHPRIRGTVRDDAAAGRLYVVRDGSSLAATFALCDEPDAYYAAARWEDPAGTAVYLHRLAVAQDRQHTGIGTWCVRQAERLATTAGAAFLRLDALLHHAGVLEFYRRLGYTERGIAHVPSGEPRFPVVDLVCFEKRLGPAESATQNAATTSARPPLPPEGPP
jgi:GNAT superfamily N-acetyltransferase